MNTANEIGSVGGALSSAVLVDRHAQLLLLRKFLELPDWITPITATPATFLVRSRGCWVSERNKNHTNLTAIVAYREDMYSNFISSNHSINTNQYSDFTSFSIQIYTVISPKLNELSILFSTIQKSVDLITHIIDSKI